MGFVQKGYKIKIFLIFTITYPKTNMNVLLKQFRLGNNLPIHMEGFTQAVLLMSVYEKRLRFRMLYFEKNDHKIILR